jgi:hypothetical protein
MYVRFLTRDVKTKPVKLAQLYSLAPTLAELKKPDGTKATRLSQQLVLLAMHRKQRAEQLIDYYGVNLLSGCLPLFAMRCNPPFLPCRAASFCPFCRARCVTKDLFERVKPVLFGGEAEYDLITAKQQQFVLCAEMNIAELVAEAKSKLSEFQQKLNIPVAGAFSAVAVEPCGSEYWCLHRRLLLVIEAGQPFALPKSNATAAYQRINYEEPSLAYEKRVAMAIGKLTSYTPELLFGSSKLTAELLNTLLQGRGRSPRLSRTYGVLRNREERKREVFAHKETA